MMANGVEHLLEMSLVQAQALGLALGEVEDLDKDAGVVLVDATVLGRALLLREEGAQSHGGAVELGVVLGDVAAQEVLIQRNAICCGAQLHVKSHFLLCCLPRCIFGLRFSLAPEAGWFLVVVHEEIPYFLGHQKY